MSVLSDKQKLFTRMVVKLLNFAHERGFEVSLGDAYRDPRVFGQIGIFQGYGHPRSAHKQRLAIDLNLFKDGEYIKDGKGHEELGAYWESLGGSWGGRWNDFNHYSLEHAGIK